MKDPKDHGQHNDPRNDGAVELGQEVNRILIKPYAKGDYIGQEYKVLSVLGIGGFGIVYLVQWSGTNMIFALKTYRDEFIADNHARERFRKEANVWIELGRHPFLVQAYLVDDISRRLYIEMEYIAPDKRGLNSLEGYLQQQPPVYAQSLRWAIQVCHGMEYAYTKGVRAHRDLKPSNILIDQDGTVKITDFGLASILEELHVKVGIRLSIQQGKLSLPGQTMQGVGFGTPTYMAPEQFDQAADCNERSDIYSFGIILYQMAAKGRLPFLAPLPKNNSNEEMMRYWSKMRDLHQRSPITPPDSPLFPIIQHCLAKDPSKRYASFSFLRAELDPLYARETGERIIPPQLDDQLDDLEAAELGLKGVSLNNLGRFEEAIRCFDKAFELDPQNTDALVNKGISLGQLGRSQEALRLYDRLLEGDPSTEIAWSNKGNTLHGLGRFEEAIHCFDKAIELNPRNASFWNNKGNTLNSLEAFEKAIFCCDQALRLDPRLLAAWVNKGASLHKLGRFDEAIFCAQKALELNPLEPDVFNNIGLSLTHMGKNQQAIQFFDKALEISPRYANAWNNKGNSLENLGLYEEAFHCYDQTLVFDPQLYGAWIGKGTSLAKRGRHKEAIQCFDKALELDPRLVQAWFNKAGAQETMGAKEAALISWKKYLELARGIPSQSSWIPHIEQRVRMLEGSK